MARPTNPRGEADPTALHRTWAIETGIVEGLYRLDDIQTRTFIEHGFKSTNIPQTSTGHLDNLLDLLQEHLTALDAIYGAVRRGQPIRRSAIRQLQQVIVAHLPTCQAMNGLGQWFDATLHPDAFKTMPNNPTQPYGVVHQHCPLEHVNSEIEHLLTWYHE